MPPDSRRLLDLLQAAFAQPDPAQRRAFLDHECPSHDPLRRPLDDLLNVADELRAVFGRPPDLAALVADLAERSALTDLIAADSGTRPSTALTPAADPLIGTIVAERYQVRLVLGEGGMGVVYLAEQVQPVRRLVALKLIRAGMNTRQVLARFEGERQVLALMDHPQIARVLDAGSTATGRPFFVMDLVRGVPLTVYADEHQLDVPARLRLFAEICRAVQHAHQKGIIHRDLKPTNILVEQRDGQAAPRIIDFGLAKAVDGLPLATASLDTAFLGVVAGTPLYMAPEQATFQPTDIDTRADVYALGVILYELLTGSTPIPRESVGETPLDEFFRAVREEEPPSPSERLSGGSGADLAVVAANRRVEPARLGRLLRGELDWIVMRALAKERDRRYGSAAALADDVERSLRNEPVLAGPPSTSYRLGKFVRRHRGQVVAATLLLLTLLGGIIGTTLGLIEARHQAQTAQQQTAKAEQESTARGRALAGEAAQRSRAELRLQQLERINGVLASLFENLDPERLDDDDPRPLPAVLADRLDEAARLVDGDSIGDPLAVARLQLTLGQSQLGLGHYRAAIDLLGRSHAVLAQQAGPTDPDSLVALASLAYAHGRNGHDDLARPLLEQVLDALRTRIDPASPTILNTLDRLDWLIEVDTSAGMIPVFERILQVQEAKLGPSHPAILAAVQNLALWQLELKQADRAAPQLQRVLAAREAQLGRDHPETLRTLRTLAHAEIHRDHPERAVPLMERVVAAHRARLGPGHPQTLGALRFLDRSLRESGQFTRSAALLDELIPLLKAQFGPDHHDTLEAIHRSAQVAREVRPERAVGLFEQLLAVKLAQLGTDHPEVHEVRLGLALAHEGLRQFDRAIPLYEQVWAARRASLGEDHLDTLTAMSLLADALRNSEDYTRAIALFEQCLARHRARPQPDPRKVLTVQGLLAVALKQDDQHDRAIPLFEEILTQERALLGHDHPAALITLHNLGQALLNAGQTDRAIAAFEETLASEEARLGVGHPETGTTLHHLGTALARASQPARAVPRFEQALTIRRINLGANHAKTQITMYELAEAYRESHDFERSVALFEQLLTLYRAEAEPNSKDIFDALLGQGESLLGAKLPERAVARLEEALALGREHLDQDHPTVLYTMGHLGHALRALGQPERAVAVHGQALALYEAKLGPGHRNSRTTRDSLILDHQAAGQWDAVVPLRERIVALAAEGAPADHPDVLDARNWLGLACRDAGQLDRATSEFAAVLAARRAALPADAPQLLTSLHNLGLIHHDAGRWAEAEPPLVELVAARQRVDGPDAASTAQAQALLGAVILQGGRPSAAEPHLRAGLLVRERREPDLWSTSNNRSTLGGCLLDLGRLDEARPLLVAGFEGLKIQRRAIPHASRACPIKALDRLIRLAEASGRPDEAETWRAEQARWAADR